MLLHRQGGVRLLRLPEHIRMNGVDRRTPEALREAAETSVCCHERQREARVIDCKSRDASIEREPCRHGRALH
jgi:hypothetical protein